MMLAFIQILIQIAKQMNMDFCNLILRMSSLTVSPHLPLTSIGMSIKESYMKSNVSCWENHSVKDYGSSTVDTNPASQIVGA